MLEPVDLWCKEKVNRPKSQALGVFMLGDILSAHAKKIDLCVGWRGDLR